MGTLVFILGRSGTGKSYSLRNFDPSEVAIINVQGKILPFRVGGKKYSIKNTDDPQQIIKNMTLVANSCKAIVIDDFQYVMANEFMRRCNERGYDKFTEIARHAWDIVDSVRTLPEDVIVYIMCHSDNGDDGVEKLKTIGKMLDEKIVLEGMSTIVLRTNVSDGKYTFVTQNNGKDTVKSPADMFPSYAIDNDLKYVDEKIRNYYGFTGAKSDADISEMDTNAVVETPEPRKRTRRTETATVTPAPEPVQKPVVESSDFPSDTVPLPFDLNDLPGDVATVPDKPENVTEPIVPRRRRRRTVTEGEV